LTGGEFACLFFIIGRTWGFNKKADYISFGQIAEGTRLSRRSCIKIVSVLIKRQFIVIERSGYRNKYLFNKHYDTWINSEPQDTSELESTSEPQDTTLVNHRTLGSEPQDTRNGELQDTHKRKKETILKKHIKKVYGEFANVLLTDRDYQLLVERFTEPIAKEWIETLSSGMAANPKKYKYEDHRAAILQWERRDRKEVQQNGAYRGNAKRTGTKLPDRNNGYTEPPYDSRLDPKSPDYIGADS